MGRRIGNIRNFQSKSELLQIIRDGQHHQVIWRTEGQVRDQFPGLDDVQTAAILEASHKTSARETVQQECRVAVNSFLHSVMGKSSLEILMNDKEYNRKDETEKDLAASTTITKCTPHCTHQPLTHRRQR